MKISMTDVVTYFSVVDQIKRTSIDSICPLCGHKTLHFDFKKDVFACPACGIGGGVLDAWALLSGIDTGDVKENRRRAKLDLEEKLKNSNHGSVNLLNIDLKEQPLMASLDARDKAYKRLINDLKLNAEHKKNLKERGLTEKEISYFGFKTVKNISYSEDKEGIPGFYYDKKKWKLVATKGFLIPQCDIDGKIQSCQIRLDSGEPKYLSLSSANKSRGVSSASYTHFVNMYNESVEEIILTEGPLKADIINAKTKIPVIAIPGVMSQKYLKSELKKLKSRGLKKIIIAFDMDYRTNANVKNALTKLNKSLHELGLKTVQLNWDSKFKGYDDYLTSKDCD